CATFRCVLLRLTPKTPTFLQHLIRRGRGGDRRPGPVPRPLASCVLGREKGFSAETAARVKHNFGMARPEKSYRKAAAADGAWPSGSAIPVLSLVDTRRRLSRHRRRGGARPGRG
ncbi:MAG: hypothetical protein MZV49_15715, partial [Rhodopseudomonas palustris]|nr:hypothetical protein [Rhodopseudomonas palustris]